MSYRSSSISDANSSIYTDEQTYTDSAEIDRLAMNFNLEFYENSGLMSSDFFDSILSMEDLGSDSETVESDGNNNSSESSVHKDIIWKRDGKQLEQKMNHSSDSSHFEDESASSESNNANHLYDEIVTVPSVDTSHVSNKTLKWISNQEEIMTPVTRKMGKSELIQTSLYNSLETHNDIIREQKVQPMLPDSMNLKPNTKIMIQNPSNRKLIIKQVTSETQLRKHNLSHEAKPQILHVQPLTDGSSVYLPFNVKSIRIIDPPEVESESGLSNTHLEPQVKKRKVQKLTSFSLTDIKLNDNGKIISCQEESQYPALNLTYEEKRLLTKEGIQLPTHYPLTKSEERELKRIRRKIRNKISAQDSRKRKKEYVDGLEERVKRGSEEKKILLQRIKQLEKQNSKLSQQLSKLQALLFKSTTSKASPSTCLLIVLLSALLVSLPNIHPPESKDMISEKEQTSARRVLLSSPRATEEDTLNMDEFLIFNKEDEIEFESRFDGGIENSNITDKEIAMLIEKMEVKYGSGPDKNCSYKETLLKRLVNKVKDFLADSLVRNTDYGGYKNLHGFFEPDIDDISEINSLAVTSEDVSIVNKGLCDATTALIAPHSVVISNAKEK